MRGAEVLRFSVLPETLPVEIIPCAEVGLEYVKPLHGHVPHLRKSILKDGFLSYIARILLLQIM